MMREWAPRIPNGISNSSSSRGHNQFTADNVIICLEIKVDVMGSLRLCTFGIEMLQGVGLLIRPDKNSFLPIGRN